MQKKKKHPNNILLIYIWIIYQIIVFLLEYISFIKFYKIQ